METDPLIPQRTLSWVSLFAATGTLLCCAFPILMVSLGFGAVVASLTSSLPLLVTLAEYESWMSSGAAVLLAITAWVLWGRPQPCPSDPDLARQCAQARLWNRRVFCVALVVWIMGFTTAFLLLPMRNFLGI